MTLPRRVGLIATLALGVIGANGPLVAAQEPRVAQAPAAVLRGVDRLAGELTEFDLRVGETVQLGDLFVTLKDCRYPEDNPTGDAFAYLEVRDRRVDTPVFTGWMVASSPALSALDHMRYDVWVIRCNTASGEATGETTSN